MTPRQWWQIQSCITLFLVLIYALPHVAAAVAGPPAMQLPTTPIRVPSIKAPQVVIWLEPLAVRDIGRECVFTLRTGAAWMLTKASLGLQETAHCP